MLNFPNIDMAEVKALYGPKEGRHWFDPAALKFFKSKLPRSAVATPWGNYFITSETNWSDEKRWTIRRQDLETGDIKSVGEFHSFRSREEAAYALRGTLKDLQCANTATP